MKSSGCGLGAAGQDPGARIRFRPIRPGRADAIELPGGYKHGHVLETREEGDDAAALAFTWEVFMLCGDPSRPEHETRFAGFDPRRVSPIAAPDNLRFDDAGNLWIATDGQILAKDMGWNDGLFAVPTEGADRGYLRQFLSCVPGGEVCGPEFTDDFRTLFVGIQHPGEIGGCPTRAASGRTAGTRPGRA